MLGKNMVCTPSTGEGQFFMTNREELIQLLDEFCAECPDIRFGQLIANMAVVARGAEPNAVWDMEDDELLTAVRNQLEVFRSRHVQVA